MAVQLASHTGAAAALRLTTRCAPQQTQRQQKGALATGACRHLVTTTDTNTTDPTRTRRLHHHGHHHPTQCTEQRATTRAPSSVGWQIHLTQLRHTQRHSSKNESACHSPMCWRKAHVRAMVLIVQ
jgi:hypothetical protein